MAKRAISKRRLRLVEALCDAARQDGWASDRGTGTAVDKAATEYERARQALINSIINLENKETRE